jgi:hypothetical protein
MKAKTFDRKFDEGDSILDQLDIAKANGRPDPIFLFMRTGKQDGLDKNAICSMMVSNVTMV